VFQVCIDFMFTVTNTCDGLGLIEYESLDVLMLFGLIILLSSLGKQFYMQFCRKIKDLVMENKSFVIVMNM
jgi:hypothetical protein